MSQDNSETLSKKYETHQIREMSSLGLPQELVEAVELMFFIPEIPMIDSSIGIQTLFSSSYGAAPG